MSASDEHIRGETLADIIIRRKRENVPRRRKKKKKRRREEEEKEIPLPGGEIVLGVIEQLLGYDRARVRCADGYTRLCRIPGKMRKRVWMRVGDIVLVAPWDFQRDKRGDIVYRYTNTEIQRLTRAGQLKELEELLE